MTLQETVYGFLLALALGVPIAVAITSSRTLNLMVYPILIALQSVPKVALAPILLVWLGTGIESKLAIAWLVAFFPIVVDIGCRTAIDAACPHRACPQSQGKRGGRYSSR